MNTIIIKCSKCKQRLRIPKKEGKVNVTCPKCNESFEYPFKRAKNNAWVYLREKIKKHPIFFGILYTIYFNISINLSKLGILDLKYFFLLLVSSFIVWIFINWLLDMISKSKTKWFFQQWFVLIMLFFMAPIGITLLWSGSNFKKLSKLLLTLFFGAFFLIGTINNTPGYLYQSSKTKVMNIFSEKKEKIKLDNTVDISLSNLRTEIEKNQKNFQEGTYTTSEIAKKWKNSVVSIISLDSKGYIIAEGSGFIISKNGVIVTNYHVIEDGKSISVKLSEDMTDSKAKLVKYDSSKDIAILHIDINKEFVPAVLGNSDKINEGEDIIAIGNPYGWERSISEGIISGIRDLEVIKLVQITAPISPGSSGGALFNRNGEVIGITTLASYWGAQNINFAIPINYLYTLITENY